LPDPLSGFLTLSAVCAAPTLHGLISCRLRPWDFVRLTRDCHNRERFGFCTRELAETGSQTRIRCESVSNLPNPSRRFQAHRNEPFHCVPDPSDSTGDQPRALSTNEPAETCSTFREAHVDLARTHRRIAAFMPTRIEPLPPLKVTSPGPGRLSPTKLASCLRQAETWIRRLSSPALPEGRPILSCPLARVTSEPVVEWTPES
jgi:hypothetical protein